jgi:pyrroline-5-carboxylate reductase
MNGPIMLVGCGKMGAALLGGWLDQGVAPDSVCVVEPVEAAAKAALDLGVAVYASDGDIGDDFRPAFLVFAIKPQSMDEVVPAYRRFAAAGSVVLSIAAGTTIAYFEAKLGADTAVCRAMPNTPAAIRHGMTVLTANDGVDTAARAACTSLLEAVGQVAWVDDESLMDAVTALSGSGPAYIFLLAEAMEAAGIAAGLPAELSATLARATVAGSGALLAQSSDPADVLRRNVTSPGGTTEAALNVLMAKGGMTELMTEAIAAAARRSRELAG